MKWHCFEPIDLKDYVDPEHPTLGLDNLLQTLENRNKAPSDNLSMVILFWGIKQHDKPSVNELNNSDILACACFFMGAGMLFGAIYILFAGEVEISVTFPLILFLLCLGVPLALHGYRKLTIAKRIPPRGKNGP